LACKSIGYNTVTVEKRQFANAKKIQKPVAQANFFATIYVPFVWPGNGADKRI